MTQGPTLKLAANGREKFYENYMSSIADKSIAFLLYYNSPILAEVVDDERLRELRLKHGLPV